MSEAKPSFAMQASAITDLVNNAMRSKSLGEPAMSWARQAAVTLGALAEIEEPIREFYRLTKQHPALATILTTFPGSRIVDVRDTTATGIDADTDDKEDHDA